MKVNNNNNANAKSMSSSSDYTTTTRRSGGYKNQDALADLKKREQELLNIEKSLQGKLKEFRSKQDKVIGCIDENEKKSGKRIDHIVKVISGMKPANAAEVLSVQDSNISVQIISKLNPEKVSKIFNLMDKEISARLQKSYIDMKR